jgi:acetolactate synthase I/II/III large subunit
MSKNMLDGGQVIVDYLVREKVPYVFGLCGHGNIGFLDALYERSDEIKTVSVHHESVAGFMADVYYRVAGKPTATFTSCGPGSANLPIALANSYLDSVPFLAVTGNVPTSQFNRGAFQELYRHYQADFPSTVRAYCKRVFQPTRGDMVPLAVRQAWKTMVTGRPGPVVLDVPFDIFKEAAAEETPRPEEWNANISCRCGADPEGVTKAVDMLLAAKRPVILVGQGVKYGGAAGDLLRLVERLRIRSHGRRAAPAPSIPAIPWRSASSRATVPITPTTPRAPPTCCLRSLCASTTVPRARGCRATRSPSRRRGSFTSTSTRTRSPAIIRSRSG